MEEMRNFEAPVPYTVYEAAQARTEAREKRYFAIILVLIVLLVGTNAAWLWYESQFETVTTETIQEVWQDSENGENSFIGGDYYGNAESDNENNDNNPNP